VCCLYVHVRIGDSTGRREEMARQKLTDEQIISRWVEVFQRAVQLERRAAFLTEHSEMRCEVGSRPCWLQLLVSEWETELPI
jgi:hypothetical protein